MRKLAIMQPYVFPYIGYFQLLSAVDKFVAYDDVNYIKQGWINRNNILCQGKPLLFTIPLDKQSSFSKISEVETSKLLYDKWKGSFLKTIEGNYKKAPYYAHISELIYSTLHNDSELTGISQIAISSVKNVLYYLGIEKEIQCSTGVYNNEDLMSEARIIDICIREKATVYVNPIGGLELYSRSAFAEKGLELKFIRPNLTKYKQFNNEFIAGLSIIDVLMFNSADVVKDMLTNYELI